MNRFPRCRIVEIVAVIPVGADALVDCIDPADPGFGTVRLACPAAVARGESWLAVWLEPSWRRREGGWSLLRPVAIESGARTT